MPKPKEPKTDNSFQALLAELEQIVARFESGEIELDQAVGQFERGLSLAGQLQQRLVKIDNQVTEIRQKFSATAWPDGAGAAGSDQPDGGDAPADNQAAPPLFG